VRGLPRAGGRADGCARSRSPHRSCTQGRVEIGHGGRPSRRGGAARAAGVRRSSGGAAGARRRTCSLDFVYTSSGRTDRCGWPAQGAWRPWSTRSLSWQRCAARLPHHSKLLHMRRRLRAMNTLTQTNEMAFGQIRKLLAARRTHAVGGDGLDNGHRGHAVCDRADSRDGCSAGTFARAYRATGPIAQKSVPPIAAACSTFHSRVRFRCADSVFVCCTLRRVLPGESRTLRPRALSTAAPQTRSLGQAILRVQQQTEFPLRGRWSRL
jgi:hypothetical protein